MPEVPPPAEQAAARHWHELQSIGKAIGGVKPASSLEKSHHSGCSAVDDERVRLAAIIEGTGAGTWAWNVQTGETHFNERWAQIVGKSLAELSPTTIATWAELTHADDLTHSISRLLEHFDGESEAYECEVRMRHREGHWVWVHDRGRLLTRTPEGLPEWMFGTHMDISDRKAQEERLRRSEELLNRTGELARVGGWEVDLRTGRSLWSLQTCRIHGVAPGYEPVLDEAIDFYPPEARYRIKAAVERAAQDGTGWDFELPLIPRGGPPIWVRAVGYAEWMEGQVVRLFGSLQDVTEQVRQRQLLQATEERIRLATESGGIGIWELDMASGRMQWDRRMVELFGQPADTPATPAELWLAQVHPEDRQAVAQALLRTFDSGEVFQGEVRVKWPDGSIHYLQGSARRSLDGDVPSGKVLGVYADVTALRRLNAQLAEQHELLRTTLDSIGDAVVTTDATGLVTWLNPAAERITGWLSKEAKGRPSEQVICLLNEETRKPALNPIAECLALRKTVGQTPHTVLIARNGERLGIQEMASPIRGADGAVHGAVLVFRDVTEQRRMTNEMSYRATHDALTGLINRSEFEARLERVLAKAHADRSEHALLFIDLDQFKLVNDACGHAAGDQLLQQVGKLLSKSVRARDTLARLGGDEFAAILEHCTAEQAQRAAQQICDHLEEYRFLHDERRFSIRASIGLVPLDQRWTSTVAALQAADAACYAAKEGGRNRVHIWYDTDKALHERHGEMQWATRLEQALDDDHFVLFAQKIEALAGSPSGLHAEVLIRLRDTTGKLIAPGAFLPAAERYHLASRMDQWVLERALQQIAGLPELSVLHTLCINLSGQSIGDRAFHRCAIQILADAGPEVCERLCMEITETSAITNMADASLFIDQLRALGVRMALDDFGTGASSFSYLKTLKVDVLKIDGSFVRAVLEDPLDDTSVRCFVEVARVMGVKTVAEFVDRSDVLEHLRAIGVDYAQGYLLHKPEPLETLLWQAKAAVTR